MDVKKLSLYYGRRTGSHVLKGKQIRKDKDGDDIFEDYFSDNSIDESSSSSFKSHKTSLSEEIWKGSEKSLSHNGSDLSDSGKEDNIPKGNERSLTLADLSRHSKSGIRSMTEEIRKTKDNMENQIPLKKFKFMKNHIVSSEEHLTPITQSNLSSTKSLEPFNAMNSCNTIDSEVDTAGNSTFAIAKTISISRKIFISPKLITDDFILDKGNNPNIKDKSYFKTLKVVSPLSKIINKTNTLPSSRSTKNSKRQTKTMNEMETEKILSNYDEYDALIMQMINENVTTEKDQDSLKENTYPLSEETTEPVDSNKSNNKLIKNGTDKCNNTNPNLTKVLGVINHLDSSGKTLEKNKQSLQRLVNSKNIKEMSKSVSSEFCLDKQDPSALEPNLLEECEQFDDSTKNDVENATKSQKADNQVLHLSKNSTALKNISSQVSPDEYNSGVIQNQTKHLKTPEQNREERSLEGDIIEHVTKSKTENDKNPNISKGMKEALRNQVSSHVSLHKHKSSVLRKHSSHFKSPKQSKHDEEMSSNDDSEEFFKSNQVSKLKRVLKGKGIVKDVEKDENIGNHQSRCLTRKTKHLEQELSLQKRETRLSRKMDNVRSEKKVIASKLKDRESTGAKGDRRSKRLLSQSRSGETDKGSDEDMQPKSDAVMQPQSPGSPHNANFNVLSNRKTTSMEASKCNYEVTNLEDDFIKSKTANKQTLNTSKNIKETSRIKMSSHVSSKQHSSILVEHAEANCFPKSPIKSMHNKDISSKGGSKSKKGKVAKSKSIVKDVQTNSEDVVSREASECSYEVSNLEDDCIKSQTTNKQILNTLKNIKKTLRSKVSSHVSSKQHSNILEEHAEANSFSKSPKKSMNNKDISSKDGSKSKNLKKKVSKSKSIVKEVQRNSDDASMVASECSSEVSNLEDDCIKSKTANRQTLNTSNNIKDTPRSKVSSHVSSKQHTSVLEEHAEADSFSKSPQKSMHNEDISSKDGSKSKKGKEKVFKSKSIVKDMQGNSEDDASMEVSECNYEVRNLEDDFIKSKTVASRSKVSSHVSLKQHTSVLEEHAEADSFSKSPKKSMHNEDIGSKDGSKSKKETISKSKSIVKDVQRNSEDVTKAKSRNKKQNSVERLDENPENHTSHQSGHLTPERELSPDNLFTSKSSERDNVRSKRKRMSLKSKDKESTDTKGVRKSNRKRYLPFDHWRNERLLYRFESGQIKVLGIDEGTKEDDYAFKAVAKSHMSRDVKKMKRTKIKKGLVYDTVHSRKVRLNLLKSFPSVSWDVPESSSEHVPYRFKRVFDTFNSGFGFIEIDGMQSKPTQYMPDEDLQMTVIKGHIEIIIQDNNFEAFDKDMFIVPRGTAYSVKNLGSTKALLTFVVGKFRFLGKSK